MVISELGSERWKSLFPNQLTFKFTKDWTLVTYSNFWLQILEKSSFRSNRESLEYQKSTTSGSMRKMKLVHEYSVSNLTSIPFMFDLINLTIMKITVCVASLYIKDKYKCLQCKEWKDSVRALATTVKQTVGTDYYTFSLENVKVMFTDHICFMVVIQF